ncbi:MAG: beta-lactamase family protein [Candidatus Bathyarchaeota archaeon]|nr:beta-lactamase family protein [Candidatus Bathyarchaeota archaeon]
MNKKITVIIAAVLIIVVLSGASYFALVPTQTDYTPQLQTLIETQWEQYIADKPDFEGNLAMKISSPKGDFFVSAGLDNDLTANTHFRVASVTKTFTSAAILLLHQEGLLHIDDKITDNIQGRELAYVPDTPDYDIPYKNQITIKQLLGHTAGVFDVSNDPIPDNASAPYAGTVYTDYIKELDPDCTFSFDQLVGAAASNQLSYFPPGTNYHYSNTGYSILGKIIERVSGMSYADFVAQRLLEPNGLSETFVPVSGTDQLIPEPFAEGYTYFEGVFYEYTSDNMSPHVAEGNIISTLNNTNRWVSLLYSGKAGLNADMVDLMTTPLLDINKGYGLGTTNVEGLGYGHNGGHMGYLNIAQYDPETKVAVTIFAPINFDALGTEINYLYDLGRAAKQTLGYSEPAV